MNRRGFLAVCLAAAAAPAYVRYGSLMVPKSYDKIRTLQDDYDDYYYGRSIVFDDGSAAASMGIITRFEAATGLITVLGMTKTIQLHDVFSIISDDRPKFLA